jgi:hypothetical protein
MNFSFEDTNDYTEFSKSLSVRETQPPILMILIFS